MAGYNWNEGMSNNAVACYEDGIMPKSKWNKESILYVINKDFGNNITNVFNFILDNVTLKSFKEAFLCYDSYHHTSKYFNTTNFYKLDFDSFFIATKDLEAKSKKGLIILEDLKKINENYNFLKVLKNNGFDNKTILDFAVNICGIEQCDYSKTVSDEIKKILDLSNEEIVNYQLEKQEEIDLENFKDKISSCFEDSSIKDDGSYCKLDYCGIFTNLKDLSEDILYKNLYMTTLSIMYLTEKFNPYCSENIVTLDLRKTMKIVSENKNKILEKLDKINNESEKIRFIENYDMISFFMNYVDNKKTDENFYNKLKDLEVREFNFIKSLIQEVDLELYQELNKYIPRFTIKKFKDGKTKIFNNNNYYAEKHIRKFLVSQKLYKMGKINKDEYIHSFDYIYKDFISIFGKTDYYYSLAREKISKYILNDCEKDEELRFELSFKSVDDKFSKLFKLFDKKLPPLSKKTKELLKTKNKEDAIKYLSYYTSSDLIANAWIFEDFLTDKEIQALCKELLRHQSVNKKDFPAKDLIYFGKYFTPKDFVGLLNSSFLLEEQLDFIVNNHKDLLLLINKDDIKNLLTSIFRTANGLLQPKYSKELKEYFEYDINKEIK